MLRTAVALAFVMAAPCWAQGSFVKYEGDEKKNLDSWEPPADGVVRRLNGPFSVTSLENLAKAVALLPTQFLRAAKPLYAVTDPSGSTTWIVYEAIDRSSIAPMDAACHAAKALKLLQANYQKVEWAYDIRTGALWPSQDPVTDTRAMVAAYLYERELATFLWDNPNWAGNVKLPEDDEEARRVEINALARKMIDENGGEWPFDVSVPDPAPILAVFDEEMQSRRGVT